MMYRGKKDIPESLIRQAADWARLQARLNCSSVVYQDEQGDIVREYADGRILKVRK